MIVQARAVLDDVAGRHRRQLTLRRTAYAVAAALLSWGLLGRVAPRLSLIPELGMLVAGVFAVAAWSARRRGGDRSAAGRAIDRRAPSVEDGATLLLIEPGSVLEAVQQARVAERLVALDIRALLPAPTLKRPLAALGVAAVVTAWLLASTGSDDALRGASPPVVPARLPGLLGLEARIVPPAYLELSDRVETATPLGPRVEEGGAVIWTAKLSDATGVELLVDGTASAFTRLGDAWVLEHRPERTEIVTLRASGPGGVWISPAARLVVVADEPPTIRILAPAAVTELSAGEARAQTRLPVRVEAADDHGLAGIDLVLTLAAGVGEGVSFEEQRRRIAGSAPAERRVVSNAIDLAALGLAPGSEIYVVAETRDRSPRGQLGRSDAVLVRILSEGGDSVGLGRGIVLRNELEALRSQRQILIDTERLVAARSLPRSDFEQRSHSIGLDQTAVRLRYGELLGQEFVDGRPVEAGESGGAGETESHAGADPTLDATEIPADLMHAHDSEESATFFADPVRMQLRAMLGAMWKAELHLRTFEPRAALPFEREALRLLKDLQEKSRRYVPKFGSALPPFEERRRLTGERAKIRDITLRLPPPSASGGGAALGYWSALAQATQAPQALFGLSRFLETEAARGALTDLSVLDAARRVESAAQLAGDREAVARGLWGLLPEPEAVPRSRISAPAEPR